MIVKFSPICCFLIICLAYPITDFAGEKYLVLTTKGILGFKNLLLVVGYYVAAFICLIFFVLFFYLHRKQNKKKSE